MRGPGRIVVAAAVTAAAVAVLAFVAQLYVVVGCGLNQNVEKGSDLDRFCDGPVASTYWILVPVAVVLAGAGAAVWMLRGAPLVVGACLAAVFALVPGGLAQSLSSEAPEPFETPAAEDGPPSSRSVTMVQPPPGSTRRVPPELRIAEIAQDEASQVSHAIGYCLSRNVPARACEDPAVRQDDVVPQYDLRVRVPSTEEWTISTRTRALGRVYTYTLHRDVRRKRIVHTCAPRGTPVCNRRGRIVERLDSGY